MKDVNPFFAVTVVVFVAYVALALLGSREQGNAAPLRGRRLREQLQAWVHGKHSSRQMPRMSKAENVLQRQVWKS